MNSAARVIAPPREGKQLIEATRPFTEESLVDSWFALSTTLGLLGFGVWLLAQPLAWPLRASLAVVQALLVVRMFVLYHDHLHAALLRKSKLARGIFWLFGVWVLAPPRVWRETHNYHHAHNAKIVGSHIGSYPLQTVEWWQGAGPRERRLYAFVRHPATVFFAFFTAFLLDMGVLAFLRGKKKRWDSLVAVALFFALAGLVIGRFGLAVWAWAVFAPHFLACALGAYLFYAQHNYPDVELQPREKWDYSRAALESSSYMPMGPLMAYFTANIGYHHVHHLNPSIPFYRLPEVMAAIPELQTPGRTVLTLSGMRDCFALKLWDAANGKMVGYPEPADITSVSIDIA
jgi:omega-6 fatty acid desaturase (delta-12 desaturase)